MILEKSEMWPAVEQATPWTIQQQRESKGSGDVLLTEGFFEFVQQNGYSNGSGRPVSGSRGNTIDTLWHSNVASQNMDSAEQAVHGQWQFLYLKQYNFGEIGQLPIFAELTSNTLLFRIRKT